MSAECAAFIDTVSTAFSAAFYATLRATLSTALIPAHYAAFRRTVDTAFWCT